MSLSSLLMWINVLYSWFILVISTMGKLLWWSWRLHWTPLLWPYLFCFCLFVFVFLCMHVGNSQTFLKICTHVHSDLKMTWFDFGSQRSRSLQRHVYFECETNSDWSDWWCQLLRHESLWSQNVKNTWRDFGNMGQTYFGECSVLVVKGNWDLIYCDVRV